MDARFTSFGTPATPQQTEAGHILIEECAEVALEWPNDAYFDLKRQCLVTQQRATKLLRFGVDEIQPGQPHTNAERLGQEIGDLLATLEVVVASGLVSLDQIEDGRARKRVKLQKYMQTNSLGPDPSAVRDLSLRVPHTKDPGSFW